jgi:hypothetical protein
MHHAATCGQGRAREEHALCGLSARGRGWVGGVLAGSCRHSRQFDLNKELLMTREDVGENLETARARLQKAAKRQEDICTAIAEAIKREDRRRYQRVGQSAGVLTS